jgi:hypothetical protein
MTTRKEEYDLIEALWALEDEVIEDFNNGLLSEVERNEAIADIWDEEERAMMERGEYITVKEV